MLNADKKPMDFTLADTETGEFEFDFLPLGDYYIHPEKTGLQTVNYQVHLTERVSSSNNVDFLISADTIAFAMDMSKRKHEPVAMSIFPNPVEEELTITLPAAITENTSTIILYDTQGRIIQAETCHDNQLRFSLKNMPAGLYFVKAIDGTGKLISFRRIIKK